MDSAAIIGALAGVIGTLGGAIALLYRAQVAGLTDRIADLKVQFDERLKDKNAQIERWEKLANENGAIAKDAVEVSRHQNERLDDIRDELREARRGGGKPSI